MTKQQAKQRIEKLKKVINRHRYLYHVLNRQEVSDAVLDSLKHELYKLEQQYPEFITPDSPTQRVAGNVSKGFKKVSHKIPMLSIEDVFSEKELRHWEAYLKRLEPNSKWDYFAELKIDGFGISLIYKDGIFVCGSTRGDGRVGEDVTQNLKTIESIPLKLRKTLTGEVEIRGEVYMEKDAFEKFNAKLKKQGKKTYANPRNLAAGSIRQLDPKLAASRPLKFLAYDVITDLGQKKHSDEHQILPLLGFKTNQGKVCRTLFQVVEYWREVAKKRDALPFQIDGLVINVNNNILFQKFGIAGKSPRGARAFKFSPKQATTKIKDIVIQVGRTGNITPVAILEPIEIGGTVISRATLHNEDQIKKLEVKIGDTVIVERAGDVIPAVVKVIRELRTGKEKTFVFPRQCPVCGAYLARQGDGVICRCPNQNCEARKRKSLSHFVSKKAFDIEGLGHEILAQLIDENLISRVSDIFELKEGDLILLERFAEKSSRNLIVAIQKSKKISLSRFLYALGIRQVGEETAVDLANYFGCLTKLSNATKQEMEQLQDIGPKTAESIYQWFHNKRNLKLLYDLEDTGIKIINPEKKSKRPEKLNAKTFVFTGSLESITRDQAKEKVRFLGGEVSESVSEKTNYIVVGKESGSKLDKAKKLGIKIINEEEFLKMIL